MVVAAILFFACGALVSSAAYALTKAEERQLDLGFQVFTKTTFQGNGRTCGTCHMPQFDYNLSPTNMTALNSHQKGLALASHSPTLENPKLVNKLGLFNINNREPGLTGNGNAPAGPFRSSMALGGLKFTSLDLCENSGVISSISSDANGLATVTMTEPIEFFAGESFRILATGTGFDTTDPPLPQVKELISPTTVSGVLSSPQFIFESSVINGTYNATSGAAGSIEAVGACPGGAINPVVAIDDGTRNIELGWAGDGAPMDPTPFLDGHASATDCINAINQFDANPTDLFNALRAFSLGAVRHHASRSLHRIPGVDFRCPTPTELDAMANFQIYLGRQIELALCSNSSPSDICTGKTFDASGDGAKKFAKGRKGTQTEAFSQNVSSLRPAHDLGRLQNVITFNDSKAETGKAIFLDSRALCQRCHFNGGAQDTGGDALGEPELTDGAGNPVSPINTATTWTASTTYIAAIGQNNPTIGAFRWSVVTPTDADNPNFFLALKSSVSPPAFPPPIPATGLSGATEPDWGFAPNPGDTIVDNQITWVNFGVAAKRFDTPGRNFTHGNDTDLLRTEAATIGTTQVALALNSVVSPIQIPFDPANIGAPGNQGDFNTQSIIEAARKATFFHNAAFSGKGIGVEDAAQFYFTTTFDVSGAGAALQTAKAPAGRGCTISGNVGCGAAALTSLASTYTSGDQKQVLNDLGFFLRALSVVYSIADCERLVQDTIDRVNLDLPTTVPALNCTTNLNDVNRVIAGARIPVPPAYSKAAAQVGGLATQLNRAALSGTAGIATLNQIRTKLRTMRHNIATITPSSDLP